MSCFLLDLGIGVKLSFGSSMFVSLFVLLFFVSGGRGGRGRGTVGPSSLGREGFETKLPCGARGLGRPLGAGVS